VYWTDERGEYREQVVTRDAAVQSTTTLPVDFQAGIRLQAFEVASTRVKREEALVLLLYWQATAPIDNNYKVFAHLVNAHGEQVDGYDSEPQAGNRRTTLWRVGETIVDWIILPIASDVPAARDYRLQIGLYDFASGQRLAVVDSTGQPIADAVVVQPIVIEDR
jgi:hypothetical protein